LKSSQIEKNSAPSAPASPLTLLEILSRQSQHSLPIFDPQALSGLTSQRYADALKSLSDDGFIEIAGEAPELVVRLTDRGVSVASLGRPASASWTGRGCTGRSWRPWRDCRCERIGLAL
jgi:hypothetical protein